MNVKKNKYPFNVITKPIGPMCNLNCDYCFYLSKKNLFPHVCFDEFKMDQTVLETFIKQYINAQPKDVSEVFFGWQGGEPTLLGVEYFKTIVKLQKKYNKRNIRINNSIQTNGTLINNDMAKFFKDNNFLVGISLDGPEYLHNKYRKDRLGNGSFHQVMEGLEKLIKFNVEFNILTVVNNENSIHPIEVYDFLKQCGGKFIQFIPIVEPSKIFSKKIVDSRSVTSENWGSFLVKIFQKWIVSDISSIYVQNFEVTLGQYLGNQSSICIHGKYCGKGVALEHNGNLYSCDHFVSKENYLGNIMENTLINLVTCSKQIRFGMNKFDKLPKKCLNCTYLKLCYGGCPKNRLIKENEGDLNWLCSGYKYYYEKTALVFRAMSQAILNNQEPSNYKNYFKITSDIEKNLKRNELCPCLSGKKYKNCHGKNIL